MCTFLPSSGVEVSEHLQRRTVLRKKRLQSLPDANWKSQSTETHMSFLRVHMVPTSPEEIVFLVISETLPESLIAG